MHKLLTRFNYIITRLNDFLCRKNKLFILCLNTIITRLNDLLCRMHKLLTRFNKIITRLNNFLCRTNKLFILFERVVILFKRLYPGLYAKKQRQISIKVS